MKLNLYAKTASGHSVLKHKPQPIDFSIYIQSNMAMIARALFAVCNEDGGLASSQKGPR
ncbi:hypothetical protein QTP70_034207 [Hemibagrus guttatus]|uniref:Uncharacterized protein n=1 Tax=Hemibagrus guttatus TaxID=175788 RepID=A0AAE0V915_9TELE|nr:hypothetical protein QTP70_034207 [Hemibagrus guttatus]